MKYGLINFCRYNADTNTVYDGTTNIAMLSVTGLWAALQIGDRTNQFAHSATNAGYPWEIGVQDLEERYKVLNALKIMALNKNSGAYSYIGDYSSPTGTITFAPNPSWGDAKAEIISRERLISTNIDVDMDLWTAGVWHHVFPSGTIMWGANFKTTRIKRIEYLKQFTTSVLHKVSYYYKNDTYSNLVTVGTHYWGDSAASVEWDDNGTGLSGVPNIWHLLGQETEYTNSVESSIDCSIGVSPGEVPVWCDAPAEGIGYYRYWTVPPTYYTNVVEWGIGKGMFFDDNQMAIDWNFQYCPGE